MNDTLALVCLATLLSSPQMFLHWYTLSLCRPPLIFACREFTEKHTKELAFWLLLAASADSCQLTPWSPLSVSLYPLSSVFSPSALSLLSDAFSFLSFTDLSFSSFSHLFLLSPLLAPILCSFLLLSSPSSASPLSSAHSFPLPSSLFVCSVKIW